MTAMPPPPPPDPRSSANMQAMPSSVATAQKLVYAYLAISVVVTILSFVASEALFDAFAESVYGKGYSKELVGDDSASYGIIALISLVVVGGLLLASALNFPKRARWARIVALVFGVLGALAGITSVAQPYPIWYMLVQILAGLVAAGIVVMLLQGDSTRWFSPT